MARSTFNSTIPTSGWFTAVHPELGPVIVSMSGFGFVKSVQKIAKDALSTPLATYDGTQISGSQITVDGIWGSRTYKALWALANRMAPAIAATIRSDALAGRAPSRTTLMVAAIVIAEAFRAPAGSVFMPTDVIPPPYGRVAPGTSTTITLERYSAGAGTGNVRPVPISGVLPTGVDIVALPPEPTVTVTIPPRLPVTPTGTGTSTGGTASTGGTSTGTPESQLHPTTTLGSGVSWGVVALAVAGVGVAVLLAKSLGGSGSSGSGSKKSARLAHAR